MTGLVLRLTLRQLLGRGRTVLTLVLASIPILLAVVYRLGSSELDRQDWAANTLLAGLVVATLLPLVAVVHGTAALGGELEDGTAVTLLATPVPRSRIVLGKLLASTIATAATVVVSALVAAAIALQGVPDGGLLLGFGVALLLSSAVYCALFLLLSIVTSRALIAGLVYVLVWEGVVNGLFAGTRLLSVRQATLGVADAIVDLPDVFTAKLGSMTAIVVLCAIGVGATWLAVVRLARWEIGEMS
jgi:ABC-2 type transport system permease protein